ncbi:hypothetical protein [Clostridium lacusfryxellense]|uniref:hypothetical protein n=1 Tax=Clostridium lacusfryxellense TaxID=205328 RepID=UPI001C0B18E6|nr:hypothetical protein [Clostridium lacusfryxellense]MBU3112019.1 hypothetical protein [Clostridium lacusfryxellense]
MSASIKVTFKEDDKEMRMYSEAISHSGKVCWIKDCINFYMNYGHFEKKLRAMLTDENKKEQ